MSPRKRAILLALVPSAALTLWALGVLLRSLQTGEGWRIVFATTGVIVLAALTVVLVQQWGKSSD
jgi:uncharacterized membrane protein